MAPWFRDLHVSPEGPLGGTVRGANMAGMKSWTFCGCCVLAGIGLAQQKIDKPAFEVASIKPSDPNPSNPMWIGMDADAGMVRYTNITLKDCIRAAYRERDFQIQGPDWISDARFEITAKLGAGAQDQIPEMLQALLADRFKLSLRHDMKEQSVYVLAVGKSGPLLKPAEVKADNQGITAVGPDGKPRQAMMFQILASGVRLTAPSATLATFVELMSRFTERPVIDMTGLTGQYDLTLTFVPETMKGLPASVEGRTFSEPGASIFDAVQQYGLKLEPRKAPLEMLTVTHVERAPTEN
jgi:uncharacterized protein (TIGR03435 family)